MLTKTLELSIKFLVIVSALLTTLAVNPWTNLDPINLPKLLVIGVFGIAATFLVAPFLKVLIARAGKDLTISTFAFMFFLITAFIFSDTSKWTQIYGQFGRNTGLLAFICLASLLLATCIVSDNKFMEKIIWILIFAGLINTVYGYIQLLGMERANWQESYSPIIGTLGNPNFFSALMGMTSVASLALALQEQRNVFQRILILLSVIASTFISYKTNSSQGLIVLGVCSILILLFRFKRKISQNVWRLAISMFGISTLIGILGLFNYGPAASFLYSQSVLARDFYWHAAWNMTVDKPIFGVGIDSYGDWYRYYRSENAATSFGPNLISNSAHNLFLDIASSAGIPCLLAFSVIQLLVFRSCKRLLEKKESSSFEIALVFAYLAWFGQALISPNQLGLAIWGWILGGAIIGYERRIKSLQSNRNSTETFTLVNTRKTGVIFLTFLGLLVGLVFSIWPLSKDHEYRKALESGDAQRIFSTSRQFPNNTFYMITSAKILSDNEYFDESAELLKETVILNPREFTAWEMISVNPSFNLDDRKDAALKMKDLDPFNGNIKLPNE